MNYKKLVLLSLTLLLANTCVTYVLYASHAEAEVSSDTCPICLEALRSETSILRTLPCGHTFHATCIRTWLAPKKTCPLCRAFVLTGEPNKLIDGVISASRHHEIHPRACLARRDLRELKLEGAHLEEANLLWVDLRGADLARIHLQGAHLEWAHLDGADVINADLREARFDGTYLTDVKNLQTTQVDGARFLNSIGLTEDAIAWLLAHGAEVVFDEPVAVAEVEGVGAEEATEVVVSPRERAMLATLSVLPTAAFAPEAHAAVSHP